ncbi:hypothetical protein V1525DRAFT_101120 [Lipomyces kononenkoae]|uniref:Uncharacterized protein n=1 Tax=Lipomyces kononenkoae TaxID=34357 RepID=A0ACC3T4H0_LIPKO
MKWTIHARRSVAVVGLIGIASFASLLLNFLFYTHRYPQTAAILPASNRSDEAICHEESATKKPIKSTKLAICENPYLQPGFVWYNDTKEETQTTWVPFYPNLLDQSYSLTTLRSTREPVDPYTSDGDPYFPTEAPPQELLDIAPHQWMQDIVRHYELHKASVASETGQSSRSRQVLELEELENRLVWLRNRRILIVSDSVDRYQSEYICNRIGNGLTHSKQGRQTAAWCHIPAWNFTLMNWHIASVSPTRPSWWWVKEMAIVNVEERWTEYYLPTLKDTIGMNGKSPDLILFHTGLWDHTYFIRGPEALGQNATWSRSLNWRELRFYMQRMRMVVSMLRAQFGDDVPIMCRSVTLKRSLPSNVSILNLDRAARFVCNELDIEIMEFGEIIRGYFDFYKDTVHIDRGPLSVLWANMILWSLFRTQGGVEVRGELVKMPTNSTEVVNVAEGWNRCHNDFMNAKRY